MMKATDIRKEITRQEVQIASVRLPKKMQVVFFYGLSLRIQG
jgi:hypothetical protein